MYTVATDFYHKYVSYCSQKTEEKKEQFDEKVKTEKEKKLNKLDNRENDSHSYHVESRWDKTAEYKKRSQKDDTPVKDVTENNAVKVIIICNRFLSSSL